MATMSLLARRAPKRATITPRPQVSLDGVPHLVFQPAVDLASGRLLGFEALLRWVDRTGEAIPPLVLIPWAEAHGQMTKLNAWVLSEACAQAARWPLALQVSVNCSVFQLRRAEAALAAADALEKTGLSPDRLTVEVTEASVTDDGAAPDLETMGRLGIQVAVDDITSADHPVLANLLSVVNAIKIDGTIIAGLSSPGKDDLVVVRTIAKLSRSLGICTVAEGVETAEQVAILRIIGVDVAQGYFFSPPVSADGAYALAASESPLFYAMSPTG